mgnify:CR=1 FL=1
MKQIIKILFIGVLIFGGIVGVVYAFSAGNVDGVWSTIDTNGAVDDEWATGPASGSSDYDYPSDKSGSDPGIQGALGGDDWNQVRNGVAPDNDPTNPTSYGAKTGFGFDGVDDVYEGIDLFLNEEFLLGKWCHFNTPIYANDNPLEYVDLNIQVDTIRCPNDSVPTPNGTLNFGYRFTMSEIDNVGISTNPHCGSKYIGWPYYSVKYTYECTYTVGNDSLCPFDDDGVNANGCSDLVTIGALTAQDEFTCDYGGAATDFTVRIVGFVPLEDSTASCPVTRPAGSSPSNTYISAEYQDSCACLYAKVTEASSTAVEVNYFTATEVEQAVEVKWETTTELDNLGFNLYRKQEGIEGWVKLNAELIPTVVYPGAPFGGEYSFVDEGVEPGQTYSYWLMDVDNDGTASLHGPAEFTTTE